MIKRYSIKQFRLIALIFIGASGCHQEPLIPTTAIPLDCRVVQVVNIDALNIDGLSRDTLMYHYNDFGSLVSSTYRKWVNGRINTVTNQTFTYSADHYLVGQAELTNTYSGTGSTQTNKGYTFDYQDNPKLITQLKTLDNLSGKTLSSGVYAYDGSTLKTYTAKDGAGAATGIYTFDPAGKLIRVDAPGQSVAPTLTDGKITSEVVGNITYTYEYTQGQLTKQQATSTAGSSPTRTVATYTYDSRPYWKTTQLRFRGIPVPDLGRPIQTSNTLTYTLQKYQGSQLTSTAVSSYTYAYNASGYPVGYSRNDGARQVINYSNCP